MCCLLKMQILKYISRNYNFVNIIRFVVHFLQELCAIDRMGFARRAFVGTNIRFGLGQIYERPIQLPAFFVCGEKPLG